MHIAGPDLENIGVLCHFLHIAGIHHFGDGEQAIFLPDLLQDPQSFFPQPLEVIGGCAGFEGASPEEFDPEFFEESGDLLKVFHFFHSAGPGNQHRFVRREPKHLLQALEAVLLAGGDQQFFLLLNPHVLEGGRENRGKDFFKQFIGERPPVSP